MILSSEFKLQVRKRQIIKALKMYVKHNRYFPLVNRLTYNREFSYKYGIIRNLA